MNSKTFIRWMHRLFDTLFYGQIAFYCLFLCFPFIMQVASWWELSIANGGNRVIYDTTASGLQRLPITVSETYDSSGKRLGRTERDPTSSISTRLLIDSLPRRADSSGSTLAKRKLRKRQNQEIDSVLKADASAIVRRYRDSYAVQHPWESSFAFAIPISGYPSQYGLSLPGVWRDTLTKKPLIKLEQAIRTGSPYLLSISVCSFDDISTLPLQLTLAYFALLLLYALCLSWTTFLFKKTFGELVQGVYISTSSWLRCQKIGWLLIGGFILINGLRTLIHASAWRLLIDHGYAPWGQQPFLWPENWMWLWAGLILLVFAQLFRYGSQLQQEHDLTV